jgi:GT2 family glycosyltransferase
VSSPGPRVVALLVTHDGAPLLRRTLTALAAQTYANLELLAVDNASTDGTGAVLIDLIGPDRVVPSDVDLGFAGGVHLACDVLAARDAARDVAVSTGSGGAVGGDEDLLLLLHDDLELEPDAVERMVEALAADERLAAVGPKLRWLDEPDRLQSVGATIDLSGRVDDGLDPGELDQGQRDGDRRVLFVTSAGMLLRRRVFEELGRFDRRTHAFREDLDLCWRAAIAGYDVEVVTAAIGRHAALAAEHQRPGRVAELAPRYLAERNTLAALLKNYGPQRLLVVLPLAVLVAAAKVAGFLLTRRVADARYTIAAWTWNAANLPGTLRRRWQVQRGRRRDDVDLAPLFGRITPRLRAYLEAIADRLSGDALPGDASVAEVAPSAMLQGELRSDDGGPGPDLAPGDEAPAEEVGGLRRLVRLAVAAPVRVLLPPVTLLLVVGLRGALLPGPLRGGDLAPFPDGRGLLLRWLAGWHDSGATLSPLPPSPAQALLGVLQWLVPGDALPLRLLLLLAPLVAWALAVTVLRPLVRPALPRALLALAYAASPPALTAVASGDLQVLVLLILLPLLVVLVRSVLDPAARVEQVWRRLAGAVLATAAVIAFAPTLVVLLPLLLIAGVAHALVVETDRRWATTMAVRVVLLTSLPLPLLGPWLRVLPALLREALGPTLGPVGGDPLAWLLLAPTSGSGRAVGGVLLLAAAAAGVVAVTSATRTVLVLLLVATLLPLVAWTLDRAGVAVRPGLLLVPAAGALVVIIALAVERVPELLSQHVFGWRQIGAAVTASAVALSVATSLVAHAVTGTPGLTREAAVPTFVATLGRINPERVLVVGSTSAGAVWEVVPTTGPTLASFGVRHDPILGALLEDAVADLLGGSDPRAAARLGRLGVGAVIVPEGFDERSIGLVLRSQHDLDPLPTLSGTVARVTGAVPGVALVTDTVPADRVPDPGLPPRRVVEGIPATGSGSFAGTVGVDGELLVVAPFRGAWTVRVDGVARAALPDDGLMRVRGVKSGSLVEVQAETPRGRRQELWLQGFVLLLVVSLGARPPKAALREQRRRDAAAAAAHPAGPDGGVGAEVS